jgi:hypothetical protein
MDFIVSGDVWVGFVGVLLAFGLIAGVWLAQYVMGPDAQSREDLCAQLRSQSGKPTIDLLQGRPRDRIVTGLELSRANNASMSEKDACLIDALHADAAECRSALGAWDMTEIEALLIEEQADRGQAGAPRLSSSRVLAEWPSNDLYQPSSSTRV